MRDPIKALDSADQFKSSAAHSAAIVAFDLATLLSPSTGDASLHGDDNVIKYTIATTIFMTTSYRPSSLVITVDIRGIKTTVTVVYRRRACRRRGRML